MEIKFLFSLMGGGGPLTTGADMTAEIYFQLAGALLLAILFNLLELKVIVFHSMLIYSANPMHLWFYNW